MDGCVENIDPDTMTRVSLVSGDQLLMTGRNWEFVSKDYDLSGMDQPIRRTGFHQWCGRGHRRCSPCRNHAWRGPTRHRRIAPGWRHRFWGDGIPGCCYRSGVPLSTGTSNCL